MEKTIAAGKLWGVGVGPGDPELLTLKAVRVLRQADVIMLPDTGGQEKTALNIVKDYAEGKTLTFAKMPMVRDKAMMDEAHEQAAGQICALLDQGKQVAFLTLGDPAIYSTYMYVHEKVLRRGYPVEVVPGVPSFCAAAARLNRSLCQGRAPLLVIPAGGDQKALLDEAAMVENCGMANERIYPHFGDLQEPSGYFSLVIAKEKKQ